MLKSARFCCARVHPTGWLFDAISASLRKLHEMRKKLEIAQFAA